MQHNVLHCEICPETGICSLVFKDHKLDLMPDEVAAIRDAGNDVDEMRAIIAESDQQFAEQLTVTEVREIALAIA